MQVGDILLWGFAATLILTTIMAASKPLGLTRMDIPFMLGTLFTSNRDKAPLYGFVMHLIMGWFFALIYSIAFSSANLCTSPCGDSPACCAPLTSTGLSTQRIPI